MRELEDSVRASQSGLTRRFQIPYTTMVNSVKSGPLKRAGKARKRKPLKTLRDLRQDRLDIEKKLRRQYCQGFKRGAQPGDPVYAQAQDLTVGLLAVINRWRHRRRGKEGTASR